MSKVYVYLAGPIVGQTFDGANEWRHSVTAELSHVSQGNIVGVSPLRCEPIVGDRYGYEYDNNQFGHPQVIAAKNKMDVRRCDITLAYLNPEDPVSIGTLQEIGWAAGMDKPIILVTDNAHVLNNAVIKATVPWRFTVEEGGWRKALEVITGLYQVYAR